MSAPTHRIGSIDPQLGNLLPHSSLSIPPYFWGKDFSKEHASTLPRHPGYVEARGLIGDGSLAVLKGLTTRALEVVSEVFESLEEPRLSGVNQSVHLRLSNELCLWRDQQHLAGKVLPSKGNGLKRTSTDVIKLLGAGDWPEALITNNAIFGSGLANMVVGAYDPHTLYSNYCCDMAFYYEHGYDKAFPKFGTVIEEALADPRALKTPAGTERRAAVRFGLEYIKGKIGLETISAAMLVNQSAALDRGTAQIVYFAECSVIGMGSEAIGRGFDPAAVMSDMVFASPGTDVVDVGSDLHNSEIVNSFLVAADISQIGVITEEALKQVYDAYAYTGARMFTERWAEPLAGMCSALYVWHILNDRHYFLRRAILGYPKARKISSDQREADFDEVFNVNYRTTGFSRPLKNACDGRDPCDAVVILTKDSRQLKNLWRCLVTGPMEYVSDGIVDEHREDKLVASLRETLVKVYSQGLVLEVKWLLAHASQHAWQVNFLMEAAMFGSLLDDGALIGKLDRSEG